MNRLLFKIAICGCFLLIACVVALTGYRLRKMHQTRNTGVPEHTVSSGNYQLPGNGWYENQMNEAFLLW